MRCFIVVAGAAIVMALYAQGSWAQEAVGAKEDGVQPHAAAQAKPATDGDSWRFKRHQGMWWYWLPSNQWVYWHENKWVPYEAESYARLYASQGGRTYSSSDGSEHWGRVRYNQYGQPQYPYSQRTSGIRQLGPVPAMGGVRSLPGWGGER